jgi:hypothetical protein
MLLLSELESQTSHLRARAVKADSNADALAEAQSALAERDQQLQVATEEIERLRDLAQTAVREALRTCREAEAQRDNLQQMLQEQQQARAEVEAAAEAQRASAQQAQQEATQQAEAQLEAVRQERGGLRHCTIAAAVRRRHVSAAAHMLCSSHDGVKSIPCHVHWLLPSYWSMGADCIAACINNTKVNLCTSCVLHQLQPRWQRPWRGSRVSGGSCCSTCRRPMHRLWTCTMNWAQPFSKAAPHPAVRAGCLPYGPQLLEVLAAGVGVALQVLLSTAHQALLQQLRLQTLGAVKVCGLWTDFSVPLPRSAGLVGCLTPAL